MAGRTARQCHAKGITAQARHPTALADLRLQQTGHIAQHIVARAVAGGVIDDREVAQVQVQKGPTADVLVGAVPCNRLAF